MNDREAAIEVMAKMIDSCPPMVTRGPGHSAAALLYDAGYRLQSPEERECVEACMELANTKTWRFSRIIAAAAALLASRQPPARYVAEDGYVLSDRVGSHRTLVASFDGDRRATFAREHAKRLNEEGK